VVKAVSGRIAELGIICLWSLIGLLLTETMFTLGFSADLVQAFLIAG
jgi:hypothetical protein